MLMFWCERQVKPGYQTSCYGRPRDRLAISLTTRGQNFQKTTLMKRLPSLTSFVRTNSLVEPVTVITQL
jgi:hypothetical protein